MELKELYYYYNKFKFGEDIFHNLMRRKVHEILLISTFYDAYIFEQDGRLSEQIYGEYRQLNLSTSPRITSVPTGSQALDLLQEKEFDLVITMMRIGELSPFKLSKKIKQKYPEIPILLLLNVSNDVVLIDKNSEEMRYIDNVFSWNGDSKIFLSMIKYIEDYWNVENDTREGSVRVILLVEDSIHYYSMFHPLLYAEIMKQTQRLISEELDDINKRMRMRGRSKVLLCHTFEQAIELYEKYKEYIIAIISDIRYSYKGKIHPEAGIKLIRHLQMHNVDCPILLQSAELDNKNNAQELGVHFLHKNSKTLLHDLTRFIVNNLGFGDFIFRKEDGTEIARAQTITDFLDRLKVIPDESLLFHSSHNNFSAWLAAHGEFLFAKRLRDVQVKDFPGTEQLRQHLINIFREVDYEKNRGKIIHFDPNFLNIEEGIIRLSEGSLGGKGRGIAFLNSLFVTMEFEKRFPNVSVKIPKTCIIGTSEFDYFVEHNQIGDWITQKSDHEIQAHFIKCDLSPKLKQILSAFVDQIKYPLAVRSSGLLEDSQSQPFAGIYETFMLPNNHPDRKIRLQHLINSIKLVFASVYLQTARNYIESIHYKLEEEKMAVIIQEMVGEQFDNYFYPHISGVAQSYNFYPTSTLKNSDGIASVAVGLGKTVVEGERIFRFCPKYPKMQLISQEEILGETQKELYAIDVNEYNFELLENNESTLRKIRIKEADKQGSLAHLISTWDYQNNRLVDGNNIPGPRVVTFADVLKYDYFPLARILDETLDIGQKAMGVPVEIEFAVNLTQKPEQKKTPTFYVLQIRPLTINTDEIYIDSENVVRDELFLYTSSGMGNGVISNIFDIIYIDPHKFDNTKTLQIQQEIADLNNQMKEEDRYYILIGPGRWGSRDRFLGVPVKWHEIYRAKIIVEASLKDFIVDASQGTHFFHNLVSMNIGYFTVPFASDSDFVDWEWLISQKPYQKTDHLVHLRFDHPAIIKMDGRKGISFIYK
ncbi:MAG: hypothetical protein JXB60_09370 [Candidatus Cloacimonetes bacterium]|nr:hypothetical protein [Candidatus Cloacimonadota bacterium]